MCNSLLLDSKTRFAINKKSSCRNLQNLPPNRPFVSTSSSSSSSWLQHESWDRSNSALLFFIILFSFRDLERCTIWLQAPAQLLLKAVGKHRGMQRICGTNSCLAVSAGWTAALSAARTTSSFISKKKKKRVLCLLRQFAAANAIRYTAFWQSCPRRGLQLKKRRKKNAQKKKRV